MSAILYFHSPLPYFNLRPDFITVLLHNNPTTLQLFVIILDCVRISSDRPQQAKDVNAVLFNMNYVALITLPLWSIYKVICYFHANSSHWFNLSEAI